LTELSGPVLVLVRPQLGENIGAAARAMLNCGISELRLVNPRDGWPSLTAERAAAGADTVISSAKLFAKSEDAVADLHYLYATTVRPRGMIKRVLAPRPAAREMRRRETAGARVGVLFGPERTGLDSDEVALADAIVTAPLNPSFSSLNLAQAVLLVTYEWHMAGLASPKETEPDQGAESATKEALYELFRHLEAELDNCGFLRVLHKRPVMVRNLRSILTRAKLRAHEVQTLRGVITCLVKGRPAPRPKSGS
jgi:tRNA/rRNA methyltransferase